MFAVSSRWHPPLTQKNGRRPCLLAHFVNPITQRMSLTGYKMFPCGTTLAARMRLLRRKSASYFYKNGRMPKVWFSRAGTTRRPGLHALMNLKKKTVLLTLRPQPGLGDCLCQIFDLTINDSLDSQGLAGRAGEQRKFPQEKDAGLFAQQRHRPRRVHRAPFV